MQNKGTTLLCKQTLMIVMKLIDSNVYDSSETEVTCKRTNTGITNLNGYQINVYFTTLYPDKILPLEFHHLTH